MTNIQVQIMNQPQDVMDVEEFKEYTELCEKFGITAHDTIPSGYWEPDAYERRVIGCIFAKVTPLTGYKESIPLRVLQELEKVRDVDKYYYILSPAHEPDPFLVESEYQYEWGVLSRPFKVIARWGTHLPDMPEMEKRAMEITKARLFEYREKLQSAIRKVDIDPDSVARAILYGTEPSTVSY